MHTQGPASLSSAELDHIEAWLMLALAADDDGNDLFETHLDDPGLVGAQDASAATVRSFASSELRTSHRR